MNTQKSAETQDVDAAKSFAEQEVERVIGGEDELRRWLDLAPRKKRPLDPMQP